MSYVLGYNITSQSEKILKILLQYRGVTAKQLTIFLYRRADYTLSNEKSVYNYLGKLKKEGLVASQKLEANVATGSIYYLTNAGYTLTKDLFNIQEGQTATGWLPLVEVSNSINNLADLSYEIYKPPLKQLAHHLLLIDFFCQLYNVEDSEADIQEHRLNLYASNNFSIRGEIYRYRPDAEILIDGNLFAVEIDRSTETHLQLIKKFETYKRYLDANIDNSRGKLKGILFVVESKRQLHGIRRRWSSVLSAFIKILKNYSQEINLIMTTIDKLKVTIENESNREVYNAKVKGEIERKLKGTCKAYKLFRLKNTEELAYAHIINEKSYDILFSSFSQEFESKIYIRYLTFSTSSIKHAQNTQLHRDLKDLQFGDIKKKIFYNEYKPIIVNGFSYHEVEPKLSYELSELEKDLRYRSFKSDSSIPSTTS